MRHGRRGHGLVAIDDRLYATGNVPEYRCCPGLYGYPDRTMEEYVLAE